MKILVVDDRQANLDQAKTQLTALGHEVVTIDKANEEYCLGWRVKYEAKKGNFDLIILDLMMPEDKMAGVHEEFRTRIEHPYGIFFAIQAAQWGCAKKIVVYSAGDRHSGAMPYEYSAISSNVDGSKRTLPIIGKDGCEVYFVNTYKDPKDYTEVLAYINTTDSTS